MNLTLSADLSVSRLALLRLHHEPGVTPVMARRLYEAFDCPTAIARADPVRLAHWLAKGLAQRLCAPVARDVVERINASVRWATQADRRLLTWLDTDYPACLRWLPDAPIVLYAVGNLQALTKPQIALVGARNASVWGQRLARELACELTQAGWCVVSGLARGVDSAAHRGALCAGGSATTVALMGTGPDRLYPRQNLDLARAILKAEGLLLTEFCPGTRASPENFPRRNRLIAGLSRGVIVVQARQRSGSLVTARLANDLGREVFAVPGRAGDPLAAGTHQLLREGATLLESAADVFAAFGLDRCYR